MRKYEDISEILSSSLLIFSGILGIFVAILDFIGVDFENGPWQWLKGPLPIILLIVAALALAVGLERSLRFKKFESHLCRIEKLLLENPSHIIRALQGIEVKSFASAQEVYDYSVRRMLEASISVDDLTLGTTLDKSNPTPGSQKAFVKYVNTISLVCSTKNITYREVMSFPPSERLKRAEEMLKQKIYGYRLSCYEYDYHKRLPPLLSFMIIDSEEVIIGFYRSPYLPSEKQVRLAIKHPDIVSLFQDYYDTIWQGAFPLKEGEKTNFKALFELQKKYFP